MKKYIILTGTLFLLMFPVYSQVEGPQRIIGTFTGDLKKDIANGEGKSIGKDTYEGNFKKGYPDGKGTYTFGEDMESEGFLFRTGDIYVGEFDKGKFEGFGKLTCNDEKKTIIEGYWSNNKYIGKTREGYEILVKNNIERVECRYDGGTKNDIEITGIEIIVEASALHKEFDGFSKYINIPDDKFPFIVHVKGTIASTGKKAELKVLIERPGTWSIFITSDAIEPSLK